MVKVEMPRGQWEQILIILNDYTNVANICALYHEIEDQVYSQEY